MNTSNLLLSDGMRGLFLTLFLFLTVFILLHGVKLAVIGWKTQTKKPEPTKKTPEPKKEEPATVSEPVYYIVEKKQRRTKPSYSAPQEIRFK